MRNKPKCIVAVGLPTVYQSSLRGVGLYPTVIGEPKKKKKKKKIFFRIFFRKIYKCRIFRTLSRFQQKFTSLHLQVEKVLSVGPPYSVVVPTVYQSSLRGVGLYPTVIGEPKKIKNYFFEFFFEKFTSVGF